MKIHAPNATLVARRDWTEGLASFFVRPDEGRPPSFDPGQFTRLGLPAGGGQDHERGQAIARAYSIASHPTADSLEFCIRRVDGCGLTPKLFDLRVGDAVWLENRVAGNFTLERVPDAEELVLVCTGTGIAPFRSMLLDPKTHERFSRVVLIYGARHEVELAYADEFRELASRDPPFVFLRTLTAPDVRPDWDGARGRVQRLLQEERYREATGHDLHPDRCQILLSGNPAMIEETQQQLESSGFRKHRRREPGQIHTERYW